MVLDDMHNIVGVNKEGAEGPHHTIRIYSSIKTATAPGV